MCFREVLSSKVVLSPLIFILPFMEYSCNVWAGAPNCCMDMLDELRKWVCRTTVPAFAVSLELLVHYRNGVSRNLIDRYLLDAYLNLLNWFPIFILVRRSLHLLIASFLSPF